MNKKKLIEFLNLFLEFYNTKQYETYLCLVLSDLKEEHPVVSFWYRKEIALFKCAIVGGLAKDNTYNLYPPYSSYESVERNLEKERMQRINFIRNLIDKICIS